MLRWLLILLQLSALMIEIRRCQGFNKLVETVCRYATKRCLISARVIPIPVVHRRLFSATVRRPALHAPCFISDKRWAHDIIEASALSKSSDEHKVVILHANPGSSVLIESLLQSCDHQQIAWETRKAFVDHMKSLTEMYKTKFAYCNRQLVMDSKMKILDEVLLNDKITDETTLHAKIFGNVPEMYKLVPKLVVGLSKCSNLRLCKFGIVEPILIITGYEYRLLTEAEYFWHHLNFGKTAVYELLLTTELVKTVPLSAFNYTRYLFKSAHFKYDQENLYIVRLSLRKDLDSICSREDVPEMMLFLRTISRMKTRRVIPAFELLCPDIGITLLEFGISMMDRISDIPLNMWPDIYRTIKASSNFSSSPLYNIFQRM